MAKKQPTPPVKKTAPAAKTAASSATKTGNDWLWYGLVVLLITAAAYFPSLKNQLVNWDDDPNITENPNLELIGKGASWGEVVGNIFDLDKGNVIGNYNPLPILTFGIEKSIAGGEFNTTLIHFTNLALHLLTVWLAMRLLLLMGVGRWGAVAGGIFMGIHPMRVESVAWATERKDVLFAVFFFAALVYYVHWIKTEDKGRRLRLYVIMCVMAALSLLSKVQAVTLPLSMLVLDYWFRRPINFGLILEKIPFWIGSLLIGLANLYTLKQQGSTNDDITNFNLLDRLCIGAYSFCVYIGKLFLPYPMSPLYPYSNPLPVYIYAAPILFAAIWAAIWWLWKRGNRVFVVGMLFFFFNVMFLLQVLGAGQGFLADRFTYVPYFGFFFVIAWYFQQYYDMPAWKGRLQAALAVLTLVYAVWTVQQIGIWENGETLWSHVMKYEKNTNSLPYWNRGQYYRAQGKYDLSLKDYSQAVTINPKNPELYNSRGKTYFDMAMSGKYKNQERQYLENALNDYTAGLNLANLKPATKAELLINRGAALGAANRYEESTRDLSEGISLDPKNKNGYFNRSIVYFQSRQYEKALVDYDAYLKLDPGNANITYESGMLLRSLNRSQEALDKLNRCIQLNPKMGLAYLERGRAYMQLNNMAAARTDFQQALRLGVQLGPAEQGVLNGN
jgi:protein O-mannosyl-transferase